MSVKKDIATLEGHLEPLNHEASAISFDNTGTGLTSDNIQDAIIEVSLSSGGDVFGPASSTDKAIARYNGTTGKIIEDSKASVQDGGAVQSQGFITKRIIDDLVTVPSGYSWVAPSVEISVDGSIVIEDDAELIIV